MDSFQNFILELFSLIPGEVWGAVIALTTVWISSRNEKARLITQLQTQAEESDKQRKSDLRREVYLDAAESLNRLTSLLAKLPNIDPSSEEATSPNDLLRFTGLSAKVQLIGEPETSKLASRAAAQYGSIFLQALQQLLPLHETVQEKEIAEEAYASVGDAMEKTMSQIDALSRAGQQSYSLFEPLTNDFDALVKRSDELIEQINKLGDKKIRYQQDYMRWLLARLKDLSEPTIELSLALRKELDIQGDIDEFRETSKQNHEELQTEFENLIDLISERLEQDQSLSEPNKPN